MSKNLCPENDLSFSNSQQIKFETPLPAGTYTASAIVESTDTDSSVCLMLFYYADGNTKEVYIGRSSGSERVSKTFTLSQESTRVRVYASEGYSLSDGDTGTFTQLQIEAGDVATDYVPYENEEPEPEPGEPDIPEELISQWENPKSEVGKWWKAYATGATEWPCDSTCRETKLLHKIMDPSYELGFVVGEYCSRIEKYLADILNGTATMSTNIPKADSEILLKAMIGNEVSEEDLPTIDCERLYWMHKAMETAGKLDPYSEWAVVLDPEAGELYQKPGRGVKFAYNESDGSLYYDNSKVELAYDEQTATLYGPAELVETEE